MHVNERPSIDKLSSHVTSFKAIPSTANICNCLDIYNNGKYCKVHIRQLRAVKSYLTSSNPQESHKNALLTGECVCMFVYKLCVCMDVRACVKVDFSKGEKLYLYHLN